MARCILLLLLIGCVGEKDADPVDTSPVDADGDGYMAAEDCDDENPDVNPDSTEVCDEANVDEDCNGLADDEDPDVDTTTYLTWYLDFDEDGVGAKTSQRTPEDACDPPGENWVDNTGDCEDNDPDLGSAADDWDCDGTLKDDDCSDYDPDRNNRDDDGDGFTTCDGDCNDLAASIHPEASEICDAGIDQNCNGLVDCEDAECASWPTCYESDCGDGEDNDDDGWVDCTDDECAGLGSCRIMVAQVHGGTLEHNLYRHSSGWEADLSGIKSSFQICHSATANGGTYTFYVSNMYAFNTHWGSGWSVLNDQLVAREVWGTVKLYENSDTLQCNWKVDTVALGRTSSQEQGNPNNHLARYNFGTTGACGLDSSFLPTNLEIQSGWGLLDTSAANPWYAAAHSTLGSSLAATLLNSQQYSNSSTTWLATAWENGIWNYWASGDMTYYQSTRTATWEVAEPYYLAGQSYRVEVPCGDPSIEPGTWYMDSDGDGYGDYTRSVIACQPPSAYVADASDGDDTDATSH